MKQLPYLFDIDRNIKKAEDHFFNKNYYSACYHYRDLAGRFPANERLKIRAAKMHFLSSRKADHMLALQFLKNISFDKSEWKELLAYMPKKYISMFKCSGSKIIKKS